MAASREANSLLSGASAAFLQLNAPKLVTPIMPVRYCGPGCCGETAPCRAQRLWTLVAYGRLGSGPDTPQGWRTTNARTAGSGWANGATRGRMGENAPVRELGERLGQEAGIPLLERYLLEVEVFLDGGRLTDWAAVVLWAKAFEDGLVGGAGIAKNDGPRMAPAAQLFGSVHDRGEPDRIEVTVVANPTLYRYRLDPRYRGHGPFP